jgi:DNA-binding LytR/AlgR family response regulator
MKGNGYQWYQWYQPWRHRAEIGFWVALYLFNAVFNSVTALMDVRRRGLPFADWEPVLWESSSAVAFLLLVPCVVWLTRRISLFGDNWRRILVTYLLASVAYSLAHVLLMVAMRHGVYGLMGGQYSFGPWARELAYEYMKDFRTFFSVVLMIEFYRFALRRLQGEARMLDTPDNEPAADRPERFLVKMLGREFLVPTDKIEWAQAAGNYVNLHVGERDYPLRSTLGGLSERLDPNRFVQTHRSWLINLDHVGEIEPLDTGDARIHMHDGSIVPCSRRYRDSLKQALFTT